MLEAEMEIPSQENKIEAQGATKTVNESIEDETFPPKRPYREEARERRCEVWGTIVGFILASFGFFGYILLRLDWGPRSYAKNMRDEQKHRRECDSGLQVYRLGLSPPVSHALCVIKSVTPNLPPHSNALKFLVIGDWGRDGMCCQRDVANRMADVARIWSPEFVMNTGDNFYRKGINRPEDPQVASSWSEVYGLEHLDRIPWVSVAGNHDHAGRISAQLELAQISKLWQMPGLSYFERRKDIEIAALDTTPMYYARNQLAHFRTNFSNSEEQIHSQLRKLDERLSRSNASWKIVFGHHPLFSTGEHFHGEAENLAQMQGFLKELLDRNKVAVYFSGHEHSIEHAIVDNVHYLVSGAGSKVREITSHAPENVFAAGKQGFLAVAVENNTMKIYCIDMTGAVLHTVNIPRPS